MEEDQTGRIADLLLEVRKALAEGHPQTLHVLIDMALVEVGRHIARSVHEEMLEAC